MNCLCDLGILRGLRIGSIYVEPNLKVRVARKQFLAASEALHLTNASHETIELI